MSDNDQAMQDWWRGLTQAAPSDERGMAGESDAMDVTALQPVLRAQNAIQCTPFDDHLFSRVREDVNVLDATVKQAKRDYDETKAEQLAADVFHALYKMAPTLTPADEMDPAFTRHQAALDEMMSTSEYKQLWAYTQMDELGAAVAAATMTKQVMQVLQKQEKENPTPPAPPEDQDGDQDGDEDQPQGSGSQPGGQPQGGQPQGGQPQGGQGESQQQPQPGQSRHERQELRVAAREAATQAQQDVQAAQDALGAFGGNKDQLSPGWGHGTGASHQTGSIQARAALAQQILQSPRLRRIAMVAGRMKVMANAAQKRRTKDKADEIVGITTGDDLTRALPSEFMQLRHPKMRLLAMRDLLEGSMLQYELAGLEQQGKGPIILAVDESGSMCGTRSEWAMGIFLALLSIANKQGRDLRLIHFGASGAYDYTNPAKSFFQADPKDELRVADFRKGQADQTTVMAEALHFFNGGTDYHVWMRAALDAINASQYKDADVIVVSDDEAHVADPALQAWIAAKKEKRFRCLGILVAGTGSNVLRNLCDELHTVAAPGHNDRDALMATFSV